MVHYHPDGVTLTLEMTTDDLAMLQEGLISTLFRLSESLDERADTPVYVLTTLLQATLLSEGQQQQIAEAVAHRPKSRRKVA